MNKLCPKIVVKNPIEEGCRCISFSMGLPFYCFLFVFVLLRMNFAVLIADLKATSVLNECFLRI